MRRLIIALASISIFGIAHAALPAGTNPTMVAVPDLSGGYVIGASGYYLKSQASNNDLDYAYSSHDPFFTQGGAIATVDPNNEWGYGLNLGYIFPHSGTDLNLSYFNYDIDQNSRMQTLVNAFPNGTFTTPFSGVNLAQYLSVFFPFEQQSGMTNISGEVDDQISQVDLTLGQYFGVGCRLTLHPNLGLRFLSLERDLITLANLGLINPGQTFAGERVNESSDFMGIGPVLGLDANYYVTRGIGIAGHVNSGLALGSIDSLTKINADFIIYDTEGELSFLNSFFVTDKSNDTNRIVPFIDGKVGANYSWVLNNKQNSDISIEAGWYAANYFNATDRIVDKITVVQAGQPPQIMQSQKRVSADLGLSGPYISVQFRA